jgi:hypothetical protein
VSSWIGCASWPGAQHQRAERGQQTFPVEHALDHRQHVVVQRHFPKQSVVGEKIIDADGVETLERGFRRTQMMFALDALQRLLQAFDQFTARRLLDDGEALVADPIGMGLDLDVRQHFFAPRFISALCRAFGAEHSAVVRGWAIASLRANGSRECAPDDRLREAIHIAE